MCAAVLCLMVVPHALGVLAEPSAAGADLSTPLIHPRAAQVDAAAYGPKKPRPAPVADAIAAAAAAVVAANAPILTLEKVRIPPPAGAGSSSNPNVAPVVLNGDLLPIGSRLQIGQTIFALLPGDAGVPAAAKGRPVSRRCTTGTCATGMA